MPKLILRCNYLKNSPPAHLANYINYIGTCDGVEEVGSTTVLLPATVTCPSLGALTINALAAADVKPRMGENKFGGESVTYEGVDGTKKWERIESYGPKLQWRNNTF